ncbi:MAG: CAP domain-containing protein [Actinomycetes bacterium]
MRSLRAALLSATTVVLSALLLSGSLLAPPTASASTTREARLVAMINAARRSHGLPALRSDPRLAAYARQHAGQMAARGLLFHTSNFKVVCCWTAVGENVAYNTTVRRVHVALMHSAPHRHNILNPAFRQVGVGIVKSGGQLWVTQVFRRPA